MSTKSISLRTDEETLKKIDELAAHEDRSRNWWINQVIQSALEVERVHEARLKEAIRQADAGETYSHEEVMEEMRRKYAPS